MKALKKVIIIVLTALMLVSAFAVPASASTEVSSVATVNAYDVKLQIALNVAAVANNAIEQLVSIAQAQTNPNIPLLIATTNAISAFSINVINALGFNAVCEYVTYEISGQLVEIDPIIVIPGTGGGGGTH